MFIDVFSPEDAFTYVKNNCKEYTNKKIRNLIKELGYHPFAITQAIKYINIHKISIEKYIDRYRSNPLEILNTDFFPTEDESKSAIKAINLVLIKLEKTKVIPFKIVNCLSHCDGQNISKTFIIQILNQIKISEEHIIDETIGLLLSYSLLNCYDDEKYSMHELTQLTCKCFQSRNSSTITYFDLIIEKCFKFELNEVKDHADFGNHFVFYFLHMFRNNRKIMSKTFHHMTTSIKKFLVCKSLFEEAIEILKAVQSFNAENYREINELTNNIQYNIADCLYEMGKNTFEALEIFESVDKIQTESLGINDPSTMETKQNIALCLNSVGNFSKALDILKYVDKSQTEILGINHPDTMKTKHKIANCLNKIGKNNEALEIYYSVDKIQTKHLGINHPDTLKTKHNIALCLSNMGKYKDAFEIFCSVDKIQTEILGINHPDTMTSKHNIKSYCSRETEIGHLGHVSLDTKYPKHLPSLL
ncbi:kinesin light chain 1-like [Hydra vulgaris]|uniref:kinesin light chain 1-like n=1 Tax=Hydra vulgaris TaxID=6087 RepID=UPI0032EA05E9